MESGKEYVRGISYLVDYCLDKLGGRVVGIEEIAPVRPPFPCLTGASNTSSSFKIDQSKYTNIVAVGIDTLETSWGVVEYVNPEMFDALKDAKAEAVAAGYKGRRGVAVYLNGRQFTVAPNGSKGGYEYRLLNGDIELQMMPEAKGGNPSPELRVIFRSPFLWRGGEVAAYNEVVDFLNGIGYLEYCKVSRADLCVDRVMPLPEIDRKRQVVSLLREKDQYYGGDYMRGQRETGCHFGRGGIACRLYDKAFEISVKGHRHIAPVWASNGWDGHSPVCRLEVQLRREGLRRFDKVMDFATLEDSKADIWSYVTSKFLRIVDPSTATRKERAKPMPYWKAYQECTGLLGDRQGVLPHKELSREWEPLVKQADGCLASAWARLAANVGNETATEILEKEWGHRIPPVVIEEGLRQKARFAHLS